MRKICLVFLTGILICTASCTPEAVLEETQDIQACCDETDPIIPPPPPPPPPGDDDDLSLGG